MKKPDEIPTWGDDPLSSQFFGQAQYNERAASLNYPQIYDLLRHVNRVFEAANAAVEKDSREVLLIPRMFVVRTRAAVLAAARLAMAGEIPEAYPVLRLAIELAWYSLHIAKDPAPPERARTWLQRGDSKEATDRCRHEFKVNNLRATHEKVASKHAEHMHELYKDVIDLGAHPNQMGLFTAIGTAAKGTETTYSVGILYPIEFPLVSTLAMTVAVAYDVLRTFELIFPERFRLIGLDVEIQELLGSAQAIFIKARGSSRRARREYF